MLTCLFAGLSAISCQALGDKPFDFKILQPLFEQYQRKQAYDYANQILNTVAGDPCFDSGSGDFVAASTKDAITGPSPDNLVTNDAQCTALMTRP